MKTRSLGLGIVVALTATLVFSSNPRQSSAQAQPETKRAYVYQDASPDVRLLWNPEGYMPGGTGIALKIDAAENPFAGRTCVRVRFNLESSGWRGIYWLANGWRPARRGPNLFELLGINPRDETWGVRLVFHARSNQGAGVQFKVGGIQEGQFPDSLRSPVESEWISLGSPWTRYSLDLTSRDLSCVQGGFCFVANDTHNSAQEIEFFIDEVFFEAFRRR